MALIIVTVLLALIAGIVLGIVALNQSGAKHAAFFKDREIALTLAKAGVADALFRMNYKNYATDTYPFNGTSFSESDPFGSSYGGSYSVTLTDGGANLDEIASTGTYNGKTRTIKVKIRGNNTLGNDLNDADHGIAEAFNKHAIYANTISGNSTTVTGNICSTSSTTSPGGTNTWTEVAAADFEVPVFTDPAYTYTYADPGGGYPVDVNPGDPTAILTYTAANTCEFDTGDTISGVSSVEGDLTLKGTSQVNAFLKATGDITISSTTTSDTIYTPGTLACTGGTINGLIFSEGAMTLSGGTITGVVVCNGTLNLNGGTIIYDSTAYEATNIPVYANFDTATGGRRIYLPVLGSWKEEP